MDEDGRGRGRVHGLCRTQVCDAREDQGELGAGSSVSSILIFSTRVSVPRALSVPGCQYPGFCQYLGEIVDLHVFLSPMLSWPCSPPRVLWVTCGSQDTATWGGELAVDSALRFVGRESVMS